MAGRQHDQGSQREREFREAGDERPLSVVAEFLLFIRENKKWWLIPVLLSLLLLAVFATLVSTGLAPFIYTLM